MNDIKSNHLLPFIFFGTSKFSVLVLEELAKHHIVPQAIITTPDSLQGRKLILMPTDTKTYGLEKNIPVHTFAKLDDQAIDIIRNKYRDVQFFLVASYGLIIPQAVLDIPPRGVLNIHPSLLPQYRGATPIQQAILDNCQDTGTTIMQVDAKMDHGPIYIQENRPTDLGWPKSYIELEIDLAKQSAQLFAKNIADICAGKLIATDQKHEQATYTKKITKEQGLLDLNQLTGESGYRQYLKYLAFEIWPGTFFFAKKQQAEIRVKIKKAHWDSELSSFIIDTVVPEGQKEVSYREFLKRIAMYY